MVRQRSTKSSSGGRGSAEAVEKRRVARHFNNVLSAGSKTGSKLDGRVEKRRQRLFLELKEGKSGKALKPIDFISHVDELLGLGETIASIKKEGVKPHKVDTSLPQVQDAVEKAKQAYSFREDAWKMMGVSAGSKPRKATSSTASKKKAKASKR